jgi:DNA-binding LacI/PurR family transcriptional regulator
MRQWNEWQANRQRIRRESEDAEVLRICTGLSKESVRNYMGGSPKKLSADNIARLNEVAEGLGNTRWPLQFGELTLSWPANKRKSVALIAQLDGLPSESFHFRLIRGLAKAAQEHHFPLSIYPTESATLTRALARIHTTARPDGFILLRLTPTPVDVELLRQRQVPAVLVHADRLNYTSPVLANVVPNHGLVAAQLDNWRASHPLPRSRDEGPPQVVLAAMAREKPVAGGFSRISPGIEPSLRNDRLDSLQRAFTDCELIPFEVEDYGFRHARMVYEYERQAALYVCLSDPLAVGVKQLLAARGERWQHRVLGFDDSELARAERVASFSQNLERVCELAIEKLSGCFDGKRGEWLAFEELSVDVTLTP